MMKYRITLNEKTYEIEVNDKEAVLLDEYKAVAAAPSVSPAPKATEEPAPVKTPLKTPAPSAPAEAAGGDEEIITAPMPGTILRVCVSSGQAVKSGEVLLILEAMKMENEIVAPCDGIVDRVLTGQGAAVDSGVELLAIRQSGSASSASYAALTRANAAPAKKAAPSPLRATPAAAQAPVVPAAAPAAPAALAGAETIEAPMPGTIVGVKVSTGQTVKSGQVLLILEAMKMENEIVSPRDGVIVQILTSQGAAVDSGAPLIVLQ